MKRKKDVIPFKLSNRFGRVRQAFVLELVFGERSDRKLHLTQ